MLSCRYVCHAEVNAILNTNHASAAGQVSIDLILFVNLAHFFLNSGLQFLTVCVHILPLQRLYVTMFPCNECAKIIIQVFKIFPIIIYRSIAYILQLLC